MNLGDEVEVLDYDTEIQELPKTKERLKMMNDLAMANGSKIFVKLYIDDKASQQRFIDVINCLKGESVNEVGFLEYDANRL